MKIIDIATGKVVELSAVAEEVDYVADESGRYLAYHDIAEGQFQGDDSGAVYCFDLERMREARVITHAKLGRYNPDGEWARLRWEGDRIAIERRGWQEGDSEEGHAKETRLARCPLR